MSLLLLFLPHNGQAPTPSQNSFTPGVLQAIDTLRPTLMLVENVDGNFTVSTITYSSANNTYNTGLYGGAMATRPQSAVIFAIDTIKPAIYSIDTNKPIMEAVQDVMGNFTASTIQYSSTTDTYNSGLYGGSEKVKPKLLTLSSIDRF